MEVLTLSRRQATGQQEGANSEVRMGRNQKDQVKDQLRSNGSKRRWLGRRCREHMDMDAWRCGCWRVGQAHTESVSDSNPNYPEFLTYQALASEEQ